MGSLQISKSIWLSLVYFRFHCAYIDAMFGINILNFLFLTFVILISFDFNEAKAKQHDAVKLKRSLFNKLKYDSTVRPVKSEDEALDINFGVSLMRLIDFDYEMDLLELSAWGHLGWKDHFLQWNPANYGGIDSIRMPAKDIWTPDIALFNSHENGFFLDDPENLVVISSTGDITWVPPKTLHAFCSVNVTSEKKVYDEQTCELKFGSWTYDGSKINLISSDQQMDVSYYTENKFWKIIGNSAKRNVIQYDCCPESYIDVTFTLKLKASELCDLEF